MTTKVDSKRRVVLPGARPGEVFDVQERDDGSFLLVRLESRVARVRLTREECLRAIEEAPLRPSRGWDELAALTREP